MSSHEKDLVDALVMDALFWRRPSPGVYRSCFVHNQAGVDLMMSDAAALPAIQRVLDEIVEPQIASERAPEARFRGLAEVLSAYIFIGMREAPMVVSRFLRRKSRPLLIEAIKSAPIGFRWTKDGYNFGVPPSRELREFLGQVANGADHELRSVALGALDELDQSEKQKEKHDALEAKRKTGQISATDSRGRIHNPVKSKS